MHYLKYFILLLLVPLYAQFGKNIVQYKSFDWNYLQTKYFDIYYYDTDFNAQYVALETEKAYDNISNALNWKLKNRIPIIVYNSHNDFQQTNVIDMYMPEGVGGVTELYKNRVVIPYDGSHQDFRNVIHHELVHAFINDYIYKGNAMNMQSESITPIPLWMNEGLAEFLTNTWSAESDMWIRDFVINGKQLPGLKNLNGYLAYRGGQSVWKFIVETLDEDYINGLTQSPTIISSLFKQISISKDLNIAFEKVLNIDLLELEDKWHKYLKENYFLDINDRYYLEDISIPLIDYNKMEANYTIAPSISNDGSRIAFYSNIDGIMSLYTMDSNCEKCDQKSMKKILHGEMSANIEELHILKPKISWSSDDKKLLISAKSKGEDVLFIIHLNKNNKKERLTFSDNLKSIVQPTWNPVLKNWIAFIGSNDTQSDVYIFNLESQELINITNDIFSDQDVNWSLDGQSLLFSSDRGKNINHSINDLDSWGKQYDLYYASINGKENQSLLRVTNTPDYNEFYPINFKFDNWITFISDKNGINNIYLFDQETNVTNPITNVLTGITQLTGIDSILFFTGFQNHHTI